MPPKKDAKAPEPVPEVPAAPVIPPIPISLDDDRFVQALIDRLHGVAFNFAPTELVQPVRRKLSAEELVHATEEVERKLAEALQYGSDYVFDLIRSAQLDLSVGLLQYISLHTALAGASCRLVLSAHREFLASADHMQSAETCISFFKSQIVPIVASGAMALDDARLVSQYLIDSYSTRTNLLRYAFFGGARSRAVTSVEAFVETVLPPYPLKQFEKEEEYVAAQKAAQEAAERRIAEELAERNRQEEHARRLREEASAIFSSVKNDLSDRETSILSRLQRIEQALASKS
jgi:hypothetical protein